MLRLTMTLVALAVTIAIGITGCSGEPLPAKNSTSSGKTSSAGDPSSAAKPRSESPDFQGTILAIQQNIEDPTILMSVDSHSIYQTDKIYIYTRGVIDIERLEVDQRISVWMGPDKSVMESAPPRAVADKIVIDE